MDMWLVTFFFLRNARTERRNGFNKFQIPGSWTSLKLHSLNVDPSQLTSNKSFPQFFSFFMSFEFWVRHWVIPRCCDFTWPVLETTRKPYLCDKHSCQKQVTLIIVKNLKIMKRTRRDKCRERQLDRELSSQAVAGVAFLGSNAEKALGMSEVGRTATDQETRVVIVSNPLTADINHSYL